MKTLPFERDLADAIDDLLPQTQCGRCGYDGCRPYAEAVAQGGEAIDRCPPGGGPLIQALAALMDRRLPAGGLVEAPPEPLRVARIIESDCIGCTLCIQACPVDAIVGAAKQMHSIVSALCTGCELCVPACPVDCIDMPLAGRAWTCEDVRASRLRFAARDRRLARREPQAGPRRIANAAIAPDIVDLPASERRACIAAARGRARARRARLAAKIGDS